MKDIEERKDLELLIDEFYKKALKDPIISHFFTKVVQLDWKTHIPLIVDFWESNLLGSGNYKGNPMLTHLELNRKSPLNKEHFDRWLLLWEQTIKEQFKGDKAHLAIKRAEQIAQLMQFKIQQQETS